MADSNYIFEQGNAIPIGNPIENDYSFNSGTLISDGDSSTVTFISGRGLGAGSTTPPASDALAYGGGDSALIRSTPDYNLIAELTEDQYGGNDYDNQSVHYNMAGSLLARAQGSYEVYVHDTSDWSVAKSWDLSGDAEQPWCTRFSRDGEWLAYGADTDIFIHSAEYGWSQKEHIQRPDDTVYDLSWNHDNTRIAAAGGDNTVAIFGLNGLHKQSLNPGNGGGNSVDYSSDGNQLAVGSGKTDIYQTGNWGSSVTVDDAGDTIRALRYSHDDSMLAVVGQSGEAYIYDVTDYSSITLSQTLDPGVDSLWSVAWMWDDSRLIVGDAESPAGCHIYDTSDWSKVDSFTDSENHVVYSTDYKPQHDHLSTKAILAGANESNVRVYNDSYSKRTPNILGDDGSHNTSTEFSPDNEMLATGQGDGRVVIHDTVSWQEITTISESNSRVRDVSWKHDGNKIAHVVNDTNTAYVHNTSDWSLAHSFDGISGNGFGIAFSNDDSMLALSTDNNNVYVFDTSDWTQIQKFTNASSDPIALTWSKSDGRLAYGTRDNEVYVRDTSDWSLEKTISENSTYKVSGLAFGQYGDLLAVGDKDDQVRVYDTSDWSQIQTLSPAFEPVTSVDFKADGSELAFGDADSDDGGLSNVWVFETSGWSQKEKLYAGDNVEDVAYINNIASDFVAYGSSSNDGNVYVHWTPSGSLQETISEGKDDEVVTDVEISPDNKLIAHSRDDGVYINNTPQQENATDWSYERKLNGHSDGETVHCLGFSNDGSKIAYAGEDGNVYVQRVSDWQFVETLNLSQDNVKGISWSNDDSLLAFTKSDDCIVYNTSDWSLEKELTGASSTTQYPKFRSDDGQILYSSNSNPGNVYVYNVGSWSLEHTLSESSTYVKGSAFKPDNSEIAYGNNDGEVYIHNADDGTLKENFKVSNDTYNIIEDISYDKSGELLGVTCYDENTYLYNTSDWSLNKTLQESPDQCICISWWN